MKLLIDEELHWIGRIDPDTPIELREAELEAFRYLVDRAGKFSLWGKYEIRDDTLEAKIHAQKVTLDEVAMNELFADLLTELFDVQIRYSSLGGAGCDFAFQITGAKPVFSQYVTAVSATSTTV